MTPNTNQYIEDQLESSDGPVLLMSPKGSSTVAPARGCGASTGERCRAS